MCLVKRQTTLFPCLLHIEAVTVPSQYDNRFYYATRQSYYQSTVPTGWDKLDDHQMRYVFGLLAQGFPSPQVKTYCLFRWTGMLVMHKYGKGWWCKFADDELRKRESGGASANSNKFGLRLACTEFVIMAERVNAAIAALNWIDSLPSKPVRISRIGKHRALTADFQEVPFETFIICDNLYQGYLSAKEDVLLDDLARQLYKSSKVTPTEAERIGVFYWFASLKEMFAPTVVSSRSDCSSPSSKSAIK